MEWVPTVFIAFKLVVLAIGMFYAIQWHYDQGKKKGTENQRAVLLMGGKLLALFVVLAAGLLWVTFDVATLMGIDLGLS